MNLPALATPMSAIASGKGSLKIGAPASSRFARTSTSSRRPAGFMAMGGVCPDANLIQRLSAPVWAGRRKFLLRVRAGRGFRVEARRAFGVTRSPAVPGSSRRTGVLLDVLLPAGFSLWEKGSRVRLEGPKRSFGAAIRPVHANAIWRKHSFSGIVTGNLPRKPSCPP